MTRLLTILLLLTVQLAMFLLILPYRLLATIVSLIRAAIDPEYREAMLKIGEELKRDGKMR